MSDKWLTPGECAARKGVPRWEIEEAVESGELPARAIGRSYLIREKDCEAFQPASLRASADAPAVEPWRLLPPQPA